MNEIYQVRLLSVKEHLFDVSIDPSWFPFVEIDPLQIQSICHNALKTEDLSLGKDQRVYRAAVRRLINSLNSATYAEEVWERSDDIFWYPSFECAENAVLKNVGDMFESGQYNLVCIHPSRPGYMPVTYHEEGRWYKVTKYVEDKPVVVKCECPPRLVGRLLLPPLQGDNDFAGNSD